MHLTIMCIACWLLVFSHAFAQQGELEAATTGWAKLKAATAVTNCRSVVTFGGKEVESSRWAVQPGREKLERESEVEFKNEDGSFLLKRAGQERWQLARITQPDSKVEQLDLSFLPIQAFSLAKKSLLRIARESPEAFERWSTSEDGMVTCQMHAVKGEVERGVENEIDSVRLTLDPDKLFRLVSLEYEQEVGTEKPFVKKVTSVFEYSDEEPYFPNKIRRTYSSRGRSMEEIRIFEQISHAPLAESEFTLTHYGLAEIRSASVAWYSRPIVYMGAVFAVVALVFGIRYLRHS